MATGTVEEVGHIASICSHETRDMNAAADLTLRLEPQPRGWCHPHQGVFPTSVSLI